MKPITIHIVNSIDDHMERIQNLIRIRAYDNFLRRNKHSNGELEDWLSAERALITLLPAAVDAEETRFLIYFEVPEIKPGDLEIHVTNQDLLIHAEIRDESGGDPDGIVKSRSAFGVIRFSATVDPVGVRAEYAEGTLRLTAPLAKKSRRLQKSA